MPKRRKRKVPSKQKKIIRKLFYDYENAQENEEYMLNPEDGKSDAENDKIEVARLLLGFRTQRALRRAVGLRPEKEKPEGV